MLLADPALSPDAVQAVAVAAAVVAVLALLLAAVLALRLTRLRSAYDRLVEGDPSLGFRGAVDRMDGLRRDVQVLREDLSAVRTDLGDALRHVAVVRYDAFADMGGRLSFSAALLDDAGNGLVVSSINSRSDARTYAKGIRGGSSEHTLSPEEQEAVARAGQHPRR